MKQSAAERETLLKELAKGTPAPPDDEIDVFFKSVAMTVKSFPPLIRAETKSRIFQIISDAEIQLLRSPNPPSRILLLWK